MARNPLEMIRHYLVSYENMLKEREKAGYGPERLALIHSKISLLQTLEADMETEYFSR